MKTIRTLLIGALIAGLPTLAGGAIQRKAAHPPIRKAAPPAIAPARDWTRTATRLPSGAFLLGNPDARVKLVEYLSLTCPHCAHFESEGIPPLTAKYVRPGLVSYEVRHALRDAFDFAGSLLVRCDGPQAYFAVLPKAYAQQGEWFARAQAWAQTAQTDGLPPDELLPKVAGGAGFDAVFGYPAAKVSQCLANQEERATLTAMAGEAWRRPGFPGTPAFLINDGLRPDIRTWADLDAALTTALHATSSARKTARR